MRIDDAILSGSVLGSSAVVSISGSFTGSGHIETSSYAVTSSKIWITDHINQTPTASAMVYISTDDYETGSFTPDARTLYLIYDS
jgi:hypothetical protein